MTTNPDPGPNILFLDNHLIAVYKPFGMLTQSDKTGVPSLWDETRYWIKKEFNKPGNVYLGLVHRLDQPVAGVVVFARTSKAAARLSQQFRERTTQKVYRAVVEGRWKHPEGELVHFIRKEKTRKSTVFPRQTEGAKRAELACKVVRLFPENTLLEVELKTGRFHQIRAQLAFLGYPIKGDVKYGASCPLPQKQIALFAWKLIFDHPISKEKITIESPEPPGWPFISKD